MQKREGPWTLGCTKILASLAKSSISSIFFLFIPIDCKRLLVVGIGTGSFDEFLTNSSNVTRWFFFRSLFHKRDEMVSEWDTSDEGFRSKAWKKAIWFEIRG
jgi:hypothetical protein